MAKEARQRRPGKAFAGQVDRKRIGAERDAPDSGQHGLFAVDFTIEALEGVLRLGQVRLVPEPGVQVSEEHVGRAAARSLRALRGFQRKASTYWQRGLGQSTGQTGAKSFKP